MAPYRLRMSATNHEIRERAAREAFEKLGRARARRRGWPCTAARAITWGRSTTRVEATFVVRGAGFDDREVKADLDAEELRGVLLGDREAPLVGSVHVLPRKRDRSVTIDPSEARPGVEVVDLDGVIPGLTARIDEGHDGAKDDLALFAGRGIEDVLVRPIRVDHGTPGGVEEERIRPLAEPHGLVSGLGLEAVDVADVVGADERLFRRISDHDVDPTLAVRGGDPAVCPAQLVVEDAVRWRVLDARIAVPAAPTHADRERNERQSACRARSHTSR